MPGDTGSKTVVGAEGAEYHRREDVRGGGRDMRGGQTRQGMRR